LTGESEGKDVAMEEDDGGSVRGGEELGIKLPPEDHLLGIFDLVGEMMRFGITNLATSAKPPFPKLPSTSVSRSPSTKTPNGKVSE